MPLFVWVWDHVIWDHVIIRSCDTGYVRTSLITMQLQREVLQRKLKLCLLVHHAVNGRPPSYSTELVTPVYSPGRASLWSAKSTLFSRQGGRSPSAVAAPWAWNSLRFDRSPTPSFQKETGNFFLNYAYHVIRQWTFILFEHRPYRKLTTGHCVMGTQKCLINKKKNPSALHFELLKHASWF